MSPEILIRKVQQSDLSQVVDLCHAHALYEKAHYDKEGKVKRLREQLFASSPSFTCLIIEYKETLIGYASLTKQFSTWDADFYMYLDCLFIKENYRGLGLGKKMMEAVKEEALQSGCNSVQWQTPDFNHKAIHFYEKLGAIHQKKARFFWDLV